MTIIYVAETSHLSSMAHSSDWGIHGWSLINMAVDVNCYIGDISCKGNLHYQLGNLLWHMSHVYLTPMYAGSVPFDPWDISTDKFKTTVIIM